MVGCLGSLIGILILPTILGLVAYALSGIGILFWVVFVVVFIIGLPGALITGFIHGENEYAQDRADYRELMREITEEERMDRYLDKLDELSDDSDPDIYIDNRQIHFHNDDYQRDIKSHFISPKKKK